MLEKEIYREKDGNLYYVEYDENNQPYKVYCDENGNPINNNQNIPPFAINGYNTNNSNVYMQEQPKKKKSKLIFALLPLLLLIPIIGGGIYYYNHINKAPSVDISNYEINFVAYGNEGEGKPSVDIQKIPIVENSKDKEALIDEMLSSPEIVFDKDNNLKNGDKVEVSIKINEHTAKKYNLTVNGEFRRTYTVTGLTQKPEEKVIVKEKEVVKSNGGNDISRRAEGTRYVVPAAGVNLRSAPNDDSTIITTARQGHSVYQYETRVTSNGEVWSRVEYSGKTGWMRSDLLN